MPSFYNKLMLLVVLCVLCLQISFAQDRSRMVLTSGGSVSFHINSLKRYKEGMSRENWTSFSVRIQPQDDSSHEPLVEGNKWELIIWAGQADMDGDHFGHKLTLDNLILETEVIGLVDGVAFVHESNEITLTQTPQTLVSGEVGEEGSPTEFILSISYFLGTESPLLGQSADYYFVDLFFELVKVE